MSTDNVKIVISAEDRASRTLRGMGANIIAMNQGLELARKAWNFVSKSILTVVETADRFRKYDILLKQVTGSTEAAAKAMGDLRRMAKQTPATLSTLTDAFVKMKSAGVEDTEATVRALSDAVAAFGGGDEAFKRATVAIQQMAGKGVISMEELRQQLGEAIPTATKIMAREMGLSMGDFVDQVSRGAIDAQEGIAAMTRGFQKDFDGASERMMNTWSGATSNLQDSWDQLMVAIGGSGILEIAISTVQSLTGFVAKQTEGVGNLIKAYQDAGKVIRDFLGIKDTAKTAQDFENESLETFQTEGRKAGAVRASNVAIMERGARVQLQMMTGVGGSLSGAIGPDAEEIRVRAEAATEANNERLEIETGQMQLEIEQWQAQADARVLIEEEKQDALGAALGEGFLTTQQWNRKLTEEDKKRAAIQAAIFQGRLATSRDFFGNLATIAAAAGSEQTTIFKAFAITSVIVSAALTFAQTMAQASKFFVPPIPLIMAGVAATAALTAIPQIAAAHAGLDSVPREQTFLLQRGERVIAPEQNRDLTAFLAGGGDNGGAGAAGALTINVEGNLNDDATDRLIDKLEQQRALGFA